VILLKRVASVLDRARIAAAVIGASALAVHGVARSTYDVDLLTTDPRALQDLIWRSLAGSGVEVEIRRGDDEDPLRGVVRMTKSGERTVDLVVGRHAWQTAAVDSATPARILGVDIPVVDRASLILLKLYAGGKQDLWDIEQLMADTTTETVRQVDAILSELPANSRLLWEPLRPRV